MILQNISNYFLDSTASNPRCRIIKRTFIVIERYESTITATAAIATGKGKAIPLQAWGGLEGSRRLRLPDFKTVGT